MQSDMQIYHFIALGLLFLKYAPYLRNNKTTKILTRIFIGKSGDIMHVRS